MRGKKTWKAFICRKIIFVDLFFSSLFRLFSAWCICYLHIKNLIKKDWEKHQNTQKDNEQLSVRLKLPGGVCTGPLILVSVACCAPATSQSLSPHLPYFSSLKKRAGFPLKNLCFLPPPTQGANRHERLSLRSKKISLFTNSRTIWANCKFCSEEI